MCSTESISVASTPIPAMRTLAVFWGRMGMRAPGLSKSVRGLRSSIRFGLGAAAAVLMANPLLADLASIRELIRSGQFPAAVAECDRELKVSPRNFSLYTLKGL